MSTERLFVAISLPESVRTTLAALTEPLPHVTWTQPEQLHLTLRFLGDIPTDEIERIATRVAAIQVSPFILPIEGVGTFPPKGQPRILWAGVGSGHPLLFQLRQRLDDALLAAGVNLDVRLFHPHVTLARCHAGAISSVTPWVNAHRDFAGPSFRVTAFDLYTSELRRDGAVHTLRQRFPLSA